MRTIALLAFIAAAPLGAQSAGKTAANPAASDTAAANSQSITIGLSGGIYTFGDAKIKDAAGTFAYDLQAGRFHLAAWGSTLKYQAPGRTISGFAPTSLNADFVFHTGDTLRLVGRSASQPAAPDSAQLVSLGIANGALVELSSMEFGTQAMTGAHATFSVPVAELTLSLRAGVEVEPRPSAATAVYWRGTTLMGGATLRGKAGAGELSGAVDFEMSSADSLGGKNLYPEGGDFTARGELRMPLDNPIVAGGPAWDTEWSVNWSTPVSAKRTDQPNRLVPYGPTLWLTGAVSVPVGTGSIGASADYSSSSTTTRIGAGPLNANATSSTWASSVRLNGSIPLTGAIDLVPEVGAVTGNSSLTLRTGGIRRPGRPLAPAGGGGGFSSAVSGGWASLSLTISF